MIAARFPGATVDLLYFHEGVGVERPVVEEVAPGLTAVQVEYRELERGQVMHTVDHSRIIRYLRDHVSVADVRSEEEKSGYAVRKASQRAEKWGAGGLLRRLVNRVSYRLYRKLERRLIAEGLVPWEGPLWFVKVDAK